MANTSIKDLISEMGEWWHKLIFLCNFNRDDQLPFIEGLKKININLAVSKNLLQVPKTKYPLYLEEIIRNIITEKTTVYLLQHINILFDPQLQIHPVRLLENISKSYKLLIEWPGQYVNNQLIYAEYGHPEFFVVVILKVGFI